MKSYSFSRLRSFVDDRLFLFEWDFIEAQDFNPIIKHLGPLKKIIINNKLLVVKIIFCVLHYHWFKHHPRNTIPFYVCVMFSFFFFFLCSFFLCSFFVCPFFSLSLFFLSLFSIVVVCFFSFASFLIWYIFLGLIYSSFFTFFSSFFNFLIDLSCEKYIFRIWKDDYFNYKKRFSLFLISILFHFQFAFL